MNNKKILLVGGKGFIGSHLNERLLDLGYNVVVADRGDKLNFEGIDIVYHLAGAIGIKRDGDDSGIERAKVVCNLAKKQRAEKIIFFSSGGAIYNDPESEYAKANLGIERIIQESGLNYVILRLANVYGSGSRKEEIISQIIQNKELKIKGDGSQRRDFIYIDDVVEASIIAIDKSGTYNIGSGKTYSINEVIKISGLNTIPVYSDEKNISAKAIKSNLNGWEPKISLGKGLLKTINYYKKHELK